MLRWENLLSIARRKKSEDVTSSAALKVAVGREEIERDYDRILFAAPTRRLADKTQVFPMEENDSIRTRLTHSHEVSNLARSIGIRLSFQHEKEVFGGDYSGPNVQRTVPALLAAAGLAHDLGNPPFGHQGEESMQQWFASHAQPAASAGSKKCEIDNGVDKQSSAPSPIESDFLNFDGNAQTFRLLTRLQVVNDDCGLNLTAATLATLLKYPVIYGTDPLGYKKAGIFKSEAAIVREVWASVGLGPGVRHPLTFVMEACDDIAYSIIDAEDIVKKGYASFFDLMDFIDGETQCATSSEIIALARRKNKEFQKEQLSSKELNDISMQIFRALAISRMIEAVTRAFIDNLPKIMSGDPLPDLELIKASDCGMFCKAVKKFDRRHGFQHRDVLEIELRGNNYIQSMMAMLWRAVQSGMDSSSPFDRFVYGSISENYRRVFEQSSRNDYDKRQLVCDALSGMTESYLIKRHDQFAALDTAKLYV